MLAQTKAAIGKSHPTRNDKLGTDMIMDEKTIKAALLKGERIILEAKRAEKEVPKSVWATYASHN